jgi:hypothetical protein
MFNKRGLVCGCVNGAWKFTPHARVAYLRNKRVQTRMMQGWVNGARHNKWAGANGFGERRGPTWPFGTRHVDGRWCLECLGMCLCQPHLPHAWHTSGIRLINL